MTTPAAVLDLPDRVRKRVAVLGHHLALWSEALGSLRGRVEKGRLPEPLAAHARVAFDRITQELSAAALSVNLHCPDEAPEDWTVSESGAPTSVSPSARALLHLPGLRRVWAGWLRASVLADLIQRLPRAWVVDHAGLPPQAAIAGLGIAAWSDFARLRASGRAFRVWVEQATLDLDADTDATLWRQTAQRLATAPPGSALISELPAASGAALSAAYVQQNNRWEMLSLRAVD